MKSRAVGSLVAVGVVLVFALLVTWMVSQAEKNYKTQEEIIKTCQEKISTRCLLEGDYP